MLDCPLINSFIDRKIVYIDDEIETFAISLRPAWEEYGLLLADSGKKGSDILLRNAQQVGAVLLDLQIPAQL